MEDMNYIKNNPVYRGVCFIIISIMFIGIAIGMYEGVMFYKEGLNGPTSFDKLVDMWNSFNVK